MTLVYRARWVLPVSRPPIRDGLVAIEGQRIMAIGTPQQPLPCPAVDLGNVAILPSLINAHTHLEFSELSTPIGHPGIRLHDWIGEVVRARSNQAERPTVDPAEATCEGLRQSYQAGVGLIGDIMTTPMASLESSCSSTGLPGHVPEVVAMAEVLGLSANRSDQKLALAVEHVERIKKLGRFQPGISPHAPYSTPSHLVDRCIEIARRNRLPLAMHVAESPEERALIERGDGPFAAKLKEIQVYDPDLFPWGQGATRELLQRLAQAPRTLIIHGNDLRDDEIDVIAAHSHLTVVYCPRTHAYFDHPRHPLGKLVTAGIRVALGTDSLASNPDLSLWREVQWLLAHRQDIPWQSVLEMATLHGADAFARTDLGRIDPGARAQLLTIPSTATTIDQLPESLLECEPTWLHISD